MWIELANFKLKYSRYCGCALAGHDELEDRLQLEAESETSGFKFKLLSVPTRQTRQCSMPCEPRLTSLVELIQALCV
jgi:hypothetical protein